MNIIKKIYRTLFIDTYWSLAIGNRDEEISDEKLLMVKPPVYEWYADPFIYYENNKIYIVCEVKSELNNFGYIGCFYIDVNTRTVSRKPKTLIKENFHMSFPNVFHRENSFYIMPETCQKHELRIYKSDSLYNRFSFFKTIFEDCYYVDSILIDKFLACYNPKTLELSIFKSESNGKFYFIDKIADNNKSYRPAGNPISNLVYFQKCDKTYGENIISRLFDEENVIFKDSDDDFSMRISKYCEEKHAIGFHTLNFSDNFYVFDILKERFNFFKVIFFIIRKFRRKGRFDK